MSISFNLTQLQTFLRQNNVSEDKISEIGNIFKECDEVDKNNNEGPDGWISGQELEKFQELGMKKLADIGDVIIKFFSTRQSENIKEMNEIERAEDKEILAQKIKTAYTEARDELIKQLEGGNYSFPNPKTGEKQSAKLLIDYLRKMDFEETDYGSARAIKDKGSILVNTTPTDKQGTIISSQMFNMQKEEIMKLLVHEALHCAYQSPFDTQEEEMFVETNAIKLVAQMIKSSDKLHDFGIYGTESITELASNDENLESVLNEKFINNGYEHRIKNESGDVNIEGHEIKGGNTVYIDGEKVGCIGAGKEDLNIDECSADKIVLNGKFNGKIYMSPQKDSVPIIIKDEKGNPVFEAFLVSPQFQSKKFKNENGDEIKLQDGYTIVVDGKNYCIGRNGVEIQALDGFRGQLAILKDNAPPELISSNLIFDDVQPNENNKKEYKNRPFKEFFVLDKDGSPKYKGKMYL